MNYEEALARIHSFQKYGSRLGLERMTVLMELLGNPEDRMNIIHVAGTNGKGSVCRYLATVLQENGYRVGLYTSPYLERFTERIEFDGEEISEMDLASCTEEVLVQVEKMVSQGYEPPTEFELVTAIGFVYFSRKPLDFLVLEVGLGGKGDSTNLIKTPAATVITSISFDHMDQLGHTLVEIASEKAGIIKEGCPIIYNIEDPNAKAVVQKIAKEKGCDSYDVTTIPKKCLQSSIEGSAFEFGMEGTQVEISMAGAHQVENGACALTVIEVLNKKGIIRVDSEKVKVGMKRAKQAGRLELLQIKPTILLDGAHNEAGVLALSQTIGEHMACQKLLLVIGILADKDVDRMIDAYRCIPGDIVASEPDNPRRLSSKDLCQKILATGRTCQAIGDWQRACDYVEAHKQDYDGIIFSGSLYLIGKVRERLGHETAKSIANL